MRLGFNDKFFCGSETSFFCIGIGTDGLFASVYLNVPNLNFEEVSDPPETLFSRTLENIFSGTLETLFSRTKESSLSKD